MIYRARLPIPVFLIFLFLVDVEPAQKARKELPIVPMAVKVGNLTHVLFVCSAQSIDLDEGNRKQL